VSKKKDAKPTTEPAKQEWAPTFRKYNDMNEGEQAAYRQGAKTIENKVKNNLGLLPPKRQG